MSGEMVLSKGNGLCKGPEERMWGRLRSPEKTSVFLQRLGDKMRRCRGNRELA